jgi:hypothetical protein
MGTIRAARILARMRLKSSNFHLVHIAPSAFGIAFSMR